MIQKVKIINFVSFNWYKRYVNSLFDVEVNADSSVYRLLDTPSNRKLLSQEHLRRLSSSGLGIRGTHTVPVDTSSNKGSRFLLEKEVN